MLCKLEMISNNEWEVSALVKWSSGLFGRPAVAFQLNQELRASRKSNAMSGKGARQVEWAAMVRGTKNRIRLWTGAKRQNKKSEEKVARKERWQTNNARKQAERRVISSERRIEGELKSSESTRIQLRTHEGKECSGCDPDLTWSHFLNAEKWKYFRNRWTLWADNVDRGCFWICLKIIAGRMGLHWVSFDGALTIMNVVEDAGHRCTTVQTWYQLDRRILRSWVMYGHPTTSLAWNISLSYKCSILYLENSALEATIGFTVRRFCHSAKFNVKLWTANYITYIQIARDMKHWRHCWKCAWNKHKMCYPPKVIVNAFQVQVRSWHTAAPSGYVTVCVLLKPIGEIRNMYMYASAQNPEAAVFWIAENLSIVRLYF